MNIDITMIHLGLGLLLLIIANIALGSVNALIEQEWDFEKFWRGAVKALVIAAALIAVYYAGYLNPDLLVINTGDTVVNLMTAVYLVMLAAFTSYAIEVIGKVKEMIFTATPAGKPVPADTDPDEADLPTPKHIGESDALPHKEAHPPEQSENDVSGDIAAE
uniref:Holin n=1 Tax=Caudovirales sp. ctNZz8 TaxID=2826772 RepID=A0A8S5QZQ1_9CAUD|nr:MAG TPA: hypothetical protein [Caudovirales sp. ctNZz8]